MGLLDHLTNEFRNLLFLLSRRDAERLLSAFQGLTTLRSFDAKLARAASVTTRVLACQRATIYLVDNGELAPAGRFGSVPPSVDPIPDQRIRCDDPLIARVRAAESALVVRRPRFGGALEDSAFVPAGADTLALGAVVGDDDRLLGVLMAEYYLRPPRFTQLCETLLSGAARLVGLAIIEEQHHAEAAAFSRRLKELEQLQLIARLCGGVAHDVNNALTVILGNAEYINRALPPDDDLDHAYHQLVLAVEHASSLARNLLALGQHSVVQDRVVNVDDVITRAESLFNSYLGRNAQLQLDLHAAAAGVRIDPQQLEQLVTNLVLNAADAIADAGRVTIATDRQPRELAGADSAPGPYGYVRIRITDDGIGMSADELAQAQAPFYTHKDRSMHSGIGLATVDAILRRIGGSFSIESERGRGTCVTVLLPAEDAPDPINDGAEDAAVPEDWSGVKVLVVEDHPSIRRLTVEAFTARGARVIEADSAEQALMQYADESDLDLLVSDVLMPGMNGPELAEKLREHCPYLRAMFISGYADGRALDAHLKQYKDQFLSKPFTRAQLIARAFATLRN